MTHSMLATMMSKKLLVRDPQAQRELGLYAAVFCVLLMVRIPVVRKALLQVPILLKQGRRVHRPVVQESLPQIHGRESGVSVEPTFMITASSREKKVEERILHRLFAPIDAFAETNPSQTEEKEFVQE